MLKRFLLYKKEIMLLLIIFAMFCIFSFFSSYTSENSHFSIKRTTDGYEITLYDETGKKVLSEIYPKEPWVKEVINDVLEIGISTGSPSSYVYFFNNTTAEVSNTYFNPILFGDEYIAYMEDGILILTDIFNRGLLYKEIGGDFSETANPISAIISIEMLDNNTIQLKYYSGLNFDEKLEIIKINN